MNSSKYIACIILISLVSIVDTRYKTDIIEAYKYEVHQKEIELIELKNLGEKDCNETELTLEACLHSHAKLQSDFDSEAFWKGSECDQSLDWCTNELLHMEREMSEIVQDIEQDFLDTGPYDCGWTTEEFNEIKRAQEEFEESIFEAEMGDEAYVEPPC